jgi:hypothetical protein
LSRAGESTKTRSSNDQTETGLEFRLSPREREVLLSGGTSYFCVVREKKASTERHAEKGLLL